MYKLKSGAYTSSQNLYNQDMLNQIEVISIDFIEDEIQQDIDNLALSILMEIDKESRDL